MKMKVTIVKCDRCENRIEEGHDILKLRLMVGKKSRTLDICTRCEEQLKTFLAGANVVRPGRKPKDAPAETPAELVAARKVANDGIEAFSNGASADDLVQYLRDVASAAHRRTVVGATA